MISTLCCCCDPDLLGERICGKTIQAGEKAACLGCVKGGCGVRLHCCWGGESTWQTLNYCCDGGWRERFQYPYPWQQQGKVTGDVILIRIQPSAGGALRLVGFVW